MEIIKKINLYFDDLNKNSQKEYIDAIDPALFDPSTPIAIIELKDNKWFISEKSNMTFDPTDPANIGQPYEGGYLAGVIDSTQTEGSGGERYALIVAPKASGENTSLTWGGYNYTVSGADSTWNGKQNTIDLMNDSKSHPAASFCDGLTIGGYSDWYLPAPDELELLYRNFKPTTRDNYNNPRDLYGQTNGYTSSDPSQTGLSNWQDYGSGFLDVNTLHWSSMEYSSTYAWVQFFNIGYQNAYNKANSYRVRAVRKVLLDPSPRTYISELDKYVGDSYEGGYLAGVIDSTQTEGSSGERYALIVAPKASGEHSGLTWGGYNYTVSGADSTWNGKQNTIDLIADSQSHPAASFCDGLTISGYSDWYLPAPDELELLYRNFKPTARDNRTSARELHSQTNGYNPNSDPTENGYTSNDPSQTGLSNWQDGGSEFLDATYHWSSMEYSSTHAWLQYFSTGFQYGTNKTYSYRVRAVRRLTL